MTPSAHCKRALKVAIETVMSEVDIFVSSKRNFNILDHMEELKNNAFRRALKIRLLKTVSFSPFEAYKYDGRWKHWALWQRDRLS